MRISDRPPYCSGYLPYLQEWEQHRTNKARLTKMRKHHAAGHRWDGRVNGSTSSRALLEREKGGARLLGPHLMQAP